MGTSDSKIKCQIKSLKNELITIGDRIFSDSNFRWINLHIIHKNDDIVYLLYLSIKQNEDKIYYLKYYICRFIEK